MKTRAFAIFFICALYAQIAACIAADGNAPVEGVVAHCFDGDTLKLQDRRVVRLAGIDAPETAHKDSPAQYYSRQSCQQLEELVRGQKITLEFPGTGLRDRHGRLIANVLLPDGSSVNELMVRSGAAFFYPHQDLNPEFQENLRDAQTEAIKERRGFWQHLLELPLASKNYIGNENSLRFFPEDCPAAARLRPRNRKDFGTLMDAFLAGYAPARICLFWPLEKTRQRPRER